MQYKCIGKGVAESVPNMHWYTLSTCPPQLWTALPLYLVKQTPVPLVASLILPYTMAWGQKGPGQGVGAVMIE